MSLHTWPDGTPRSTGNAFDWYAQRPAVDPIKAKRKEKAKREYAKKLEKRGLTAVQVKRNAVTRTNKETNLSSFVLNSRKAPR